MFSSTETIVGKIWAELLHLDKINPDDNFFAIGGDSLMTIEMLIRTGDAFGVDACPENIADTPTLREFCHAIDMKRSVITPMPDNGESETDSGGIIHRAGKGNIPVSFIQEQMVGAELAGLYDPKKNRSHCLDLCYRIKGAINIPALDRALREIVQRHEILRTGYRFIDGTIYQHVNDAPQSILRVEDLRHLAQNDWEHETEIILKKIAAKSFSFFYDKLMIAATLIVGEMEHILAVVVNHIAIDGLSMKILKDELFLLYRVFSHNAASPLVELPIQYSDFAVWEREYFSGDRLESKLAYWRRLAKEPINTMLPVDHTPTVFSYTGAIVPVTILSEPTARLRQLARDCKVTLFNVLFAAFIALIHTFSGYRYNFFCIPVGNKLRETRSLIGCFMNFQLIYVDMSGNPTFLEIVERLQRALRDAYENYVPFYFITREMPPQGDLVDFQLLTAPDESTNPPELSLSRFKLQTQEFGLFPIDVYLLDSAETITGHFKYQTAVYERKTILDMVDGYMSLLTMAARDPYVRLSDMGIGNLREPRILRCASLENAHLSQ